MECETHLAECRPALAPGLEKRTEAASDFQPLCREHVSKAVSGPKRIAAKNSKRRKDRGLSATSTDPLKGPLGWFVEFNTPGWQVSDLLFFLRLFEFFAALLFSAGAGKPDIPTIPRPDGNHTASLALSEIVCVTHLGDRTNTHVVQSWSQNG